jgi:lytic murein transglycosylase
MDCSSVRQTAVAVALAVLLASGLPALAQAVGPTTVAPPNCQNNGTFDRWLNSFRQEALAKGISQATITAALERMTLHPGILARDRRQTFFSQSFLEVAGKLATKHRVQSGSRAMERHRTVFQRAERDYGVPAAVITAFWALESDFGAGMGKLPVLRSLATLAYDCRRGALFRGELLDALRIIERGDLRPAEMIGSWAGELGQTQFLPSHYLKHAVDYDRDGRRDLVRSAPDIIGSSAAFLVSLGWRRGEPWLQEVRLSADLPWDQADLQIQSPRAKWASWGVRQVDGRALPQDGLPASLHLPMGRHGPAFLAYTNFQAFLKWNQALNYATTAAYLATRLTGSPPMSRGSGRVVPFGYEQTRELQQLMVQRGLYKGEVDGKLGAATRGSVKLAQQTYGLPADSYPTPELLERLRRPR